MDFSSIGFLRSKINVNDSRISRNTFLATGSNIFMTSAGGLI